MLPHIEDVSDKFLEKNLLGKMKSQLRRKGSLMSQSLMRCSCLLDPGHDQHPDVRAGKGFPTLGGRVRADLPDPEAGTGRPGRFLLQGGRQSRRGQRLHQVVAASRTSLRNKTFAKFIFRQKVSLNHPLP